MDWVATVLVVEDNADIRAVIEVALGLSAWLSCEFAATGLEALERARERDFDALLLDPGLPDMDGTEVMRALADGPRPPSVIVLTADARPATAERYRRLGASAVLTKPFDPLTLARDVLAQVRIRTRLQLRASDGAAC